MGINSKGGFSNGILYAENVDFTSHTHPTPQMVVDGMLLIGAAVYPHLRAALLTPGPGITIINSAGGIEIAATGTGNEVWTPISASQTMAVNQGYICVAPGGALSLALPAVSVVGDFLEITLDGATSFTVTQGAGQSIRVGNIASTAGVGGSVSSTQQGDTIRMVCTVANLKWNVLSTMGNPIIV